MKQDYCESKDVSTQAVSKGVETVQHREEINKRLIRSYARRMTRFPECAKLVQKRTKKRKT